MRKIMNMFSNSFKKYVLISLLTTILYAALQIIILSLLKESGVLLINSLSNTSLFFMLFTPLVLLVIGTIAIISYLYKRDTNKILKQLEIEKRQDQQTIALETVQKVSSYIIDHISRYNNEIKQWISNKKQKGEMAPKAIVDNSAKIGITLQKLSEASYLTPYAAMVVDDSLLIEQQLKKKVK